MERDSFIFYRSFYEGIKELPREVQGEVLTAIMEYGLNGVTTENLKPIAKGMFALIKPQLDANNKRFANGSKGGRPKQNKTKVKPNNNQSKTKHEPNDNVNVNDISFLEKKKQKTDICDFSDFEDFSENQEPVANSQSPLKTEKSQKEKSSAKKEKGFDFLKALLNAGFDPELSTEWLKIRKAKKAVNSEIAFKNFLREVEKSGRSPNEVLAIVVQKQWKGFEASWLQNEQITTNNGQKTMSNEQRTINHNAESKFGRTPASEVARSITGWGD